MATPTKPDPDHEWFEKHPPLVDKLKQEDLQKGLYVFQAWEMKALREKCEEFESPDFRSQEGKTNWEEFLAKNMKKELARFSNDAHRDWAKQGLRLWVCLDRDAVSKSNIRKKERESRAEAPTNHSNIYTPNLLGTIKFDNWRNRGIEDILPTLPHLTNLPDKTRQLWTGRLPEVMKNGECGDTSELSGLITKEVSRLRYTKNLIDGLSVQVGDYRVKDADKKVAGVGTALWQMASSSIDMRNVEPYTVGSISLPETRDLLVPLDWEEYRCPQVTFPEEGQSFLVSPAGSFTDLHTGKNSSLQPPWE